MKLQVYYTQWIKINSIYFPLHSPIIMINSFASLKNFFFRFFFQVQCVLWEWNVILLKTYFTLKKKIMPICSKCNWQHWKIFKNVRWVEITIIIRFIASIFLLIAYYEWTCFSMLKVQMHNDDTNTPKKFLAFTSQKLSLIFSGM